MNRGDTRSFRPLDVTFVLPSLEVGGAERVVVNLANGMQRLGHRPQIVLTGRTGLLAAQLDANVPVTALGHGRVRAALPALLLELRRQKPDVVVTTHTHVNLALCAARRALPRRTRLVLREPIHAATPFDDIPPVTRLRQRKLYRRADLVLATSTAMQDDLERLTGRRPALLRNAVDVARIRDVASRDVSPAAGSPLTGATASRTGRKFVAVGRLATQKAYPDLLAAFAQMSGPDDRLEVFGEGTLRADLERLVVELGLLGRAQFAGIDDAHWTRVARADVFVLASTHEGMPNAALEALALGTPVLATTDLDVLEDLAVATPPGAVTLVPRTDLAEAMAAVQVHASDLAAGPRASLLPPGFDVASTSITLAGLLTACVAARSSERDQ